MSPGRRSVRDVVPPYLHDVAHGLEMIRTVVSYLRYDMAKAEGDIPLGNTGIDAPLGEARPEGMRSGLDAKATKERRQGGSGEGPVRSAGKDEPLSTTEIPGLVQDAKRVTGERAVCRGPLLLPLRDSPLPPVDVDVVPACVANLTRARGSQNTKLKSESGRRRSIGAANCGENRRDFGRRDCTEGNRLRLRAKGRCDHVKIQDVGAEAVENRRLVHHADEGCDPAGLGKLRKPDRAQHVEDMLGHLGNWDRSDVRQDVLVENLPMAPDRGGTQVGSAELKGEDGCLLERGDLRSRRKLGLVVRFRHFSDLLCFRTLGTGVDEGEGQALRAWTPVDEVADCKKASATWVERTLGKDTLEGEKATMNAA